MQPNRDEGRSNHNHSHLRALIEKLNRDSLPRKRGVNPCNQQRLTILIRRFRLRLMNQEPGTAPRHKAGGCRAMLTVGFTMLQELRETDEALQEFRRISLRRIGATCR